MRSARLDEYQYAVGWHYDFFLLGRNRWILVLTQGFLDLLFDFKQGGVQCWCGDNDFWKGRNMGGAAVWRKCTEYRVRLILDGDMSGIKWGRANAWAAYTMAQVGVRLPQCYLYPKFLDVVGSLNDQLAALKLYQTENGLWRTIVDDVASYEEVSASAGIAAAMITKGNPRYAVQRQRRRSCDECFGRDGRYEGCRRLPQHQPRLDPGLGSGSGAGVFCRCAELRQRSFRRRAVNCPADKSSRCRMNRIPSSVQ